VIFLDSSAVVKLARREAETDALRNWLGANPLPLVASALVRIETARALRHTEPSALPVLASVLALLHQFPVSDSVLDAAGRLPDPGLRSLGAIHLATAAEHVEALVWFVVYDRRLARAAQTARLPVAAPA
jgi:predicted nucleic acid-binding protein